MSIKQASSTVLAIMLVVSIIVNVNPFSAFIFPNVLASPPPGYNYSPSFNATGSNFSDIPHHPTLSLEKFSVAAWFKTSKNYTDEGLIVNKGGFGSELAGQNLNYGIWMDKDEKIRAGFETASGTDYFLKSTSTYSDNNWHYAVVTYDGSNVRLYIDGLQVAGRTFAITPPDTGGTQPLRIGANSRGDNNYFTGGIDEVRVWSSALTAAEVLDQYNVGIFSANKLIVYMDGVTFNFTPVANAGPDQTVSEGSPVGLNGAASSDPDNDTLSHSWTKTAGPTVTLSNSNTATPTFTAPSVGPSGSTLTFKLTVSDGKGGTATDTVDVIVQNINQPPVANAGPDQTVSEGSPVGLNGAASSDPDNDTLSHSWTQTAGPTVTLSNSNTATPTFTAPSVGPSGSTLTFKLTVSDGKGGTATDTVNVIVNNIDESGYDYPASFNAVS